MAVQDINSSSVKREWWLKHFLSMLGAWPGFYLGLRLFHTKRYLPDEYSALWWDALIPAAIIAFIMPYILTAKRTKEFKAEVGAHQAAKDAQQRDAQAKALEEWSSKTPKERPFAGLSLGTSTGLLHGRVASNERNYGIPSVDANGGPFYAHLFPEDTFKNIIIFGSIGSGKTTRAINPLLKQLLETDTGALIFDIKTDFFQEVEALCKMTGRAYKVIGDDGMPVNLIGGCTPDLATSFLESCFSAKGQGVGDNAFWVQGALDLCRNCLLMTQLVGGEYTVRGLHRLVFSEEDRKDMLAKMVEKFAANEFDEEQEIAAELVQEFFAKVWPKHEEKVASGIISTIATVLNPLQSPGMVKAFSPAPDKPEADLPALIRDGEVFLVNIPRTKYGDGGSRYAYMLLKLGFMNMMRGRTSRRDWNQTRPVAFVCDEYQSIIDPISDTDFWDKSRSTKTIGLVSMQGVSSMIQALGKDVTANAILQNFRQKLIFRTEDSATYGMVQGLLGQVDIQHINESENYSYGNSVSGNGPGGRPGQAQNMSQSENWSQGTSMNWGRQELFGPNDMRNLNGNQVLFIGNQGDIAVDEVLNVKPLYLKQASQAERA